MKSHCHLYFHHQNQVLVNNNYFLALVAGLILGLLVVVTAHFVSCEDGEAADLGGGDNGPNLWQLVGSVGNVSLQLIMQLLVGT